MKCSLFSLFQQPTDRKRCLWIIVLTFAVGGLGGLLGGSAAYATLQKPPLSPPTWVFPAVWSALYLLMALAACRVAAAGGDSGKALRLYWTQLAVNALWPLFFFRFEWRLFAFFWLLLLLALIARTIARFDRLDECAARWLYPYLLWVLFAGYLNLGVYLLNR